MECAADPIHCQPGGSAGHSRMPPACHQSVCVDTATELLVKVKPGGYHVGYGEARIVTVLGSCVTACARDPQLGIGGINHFLLPRPNHYSGPASTRYGEQAMSMLIEAILARGGERGRLEFKLFGGAHVLRDAQYDVGQHNIDFIRDYVRREALTVVNEDLGGKVSRRLIYDVRSGGVKLRCSAMEFDRELCNDEQRLLMATHSQYTG